MNAGDWKCLIGITVVIALLATLFGFSIRTAVVESRQLTQCQAAGYTWRREYANIVYCLRMQDGRLLGMSLQEVEASR